MDDDLDVGRGSHILASVSRVRAARTAASSVVVPRVPKTTWGFVYRRHPKPDEEKFVIVDEVKFTVLILVIFGCTCAAGFFVADVVLGRVRFSDIEDEGGHGAAVIIGAVFAFLACVLSFVQVRAHHRAWTHPPSQRLIVRILYMVPIYAISAWLSLTFLHFSSYIDFVRGVYEAYVIYTFMILLTKYLGGHSGVVEWMKTKPLQKWPSPLGFLKPVKPDSQYLYYLKYGALQYTILTPICSLAVVVLTSFGAYEDGVIAYNNGYPYIAFILNSSQLVSLYALVWLYMCMKQELMPFGPFYKFACVKAVVFLTFWQGVALAFAAKFGWIEETSHFTLGEVQVGMQDFLICIEMFLAACFHKYTFGAETYADGSIRTIMEQRALYLAEQSYKKAQEAAREAQALADAVAEAADPSLRGKGKLTTEETPEEAAARKKAMAAMIKKAMDEDTEGDTLFDEKEQDWTTGQLPSLHSSLSPVAINAAFDYVYAYELEHQRAEGVDPAVAAAHRQQAYVPMTDVDFGIVEENPVEYPGTGASTTSGNAGYVRTPEGDDDEYAYDRPPSPSRASGVRDEEEILDEESTEMPPSSRPQLQQNQQPASQAALQQQARAQLQANVQKLVPPTQARAQPMQRPMQQQQQQPQQQQFRTPQPQRTGQPLRGPQQSAQQQQQQPQRPKSTAPVPKQQQSRPQQQLPPAQGRRPMPTRSPAPAASAPPVVIDVSQDENPFE